MWSQKTKIFMEVKTERCRGANICCSKKQSEKNMPPIDSGAYKAILRGDDNPVGKDALQDTP